MSKEVLDRAEIDRIIHASQVCRLALAADDLPYLVPVCFGYDGSAVYFHSGQEGKKLDYIRANNRVCFEFEHGVRFLPNEHSACKWSVAYECVIGYGTIQELLDPEQKEYGLNRIMAQYSNQEWTFDNAVLSRTRVWKIVIDLVTGKRAGPPPAAAPAGLP